MVRPKANTHPAIPSLCGRALRHLLQSTSHPHRRYVGYTQDLRQQITDHNSGKNTSTRPYRPWSLRTYLAFSTNLQALGFEGYLKSGSGHAFARKRLW